LGPHSLAYSTDEVRGEHESRLTAGG
jgi:hypothetical protein